MAMVRSSSGESKDALICRANEVQDQAHYPRVFTSWNPNYEKIIQDGKFNMSLNLKPAFTGRDKILLHFNRVTPDQLKKVSEELLSRQYVDHIATLKFGEVYA